jgi:NADH dehydrogenase
MERVPVVVILGGGFAGLHAVKVLADAPVRIILVDKNNYHLFQPLLYQVATAGLAPEDISYPLRAILQRQGNTDFHMAEAVDLDLEGKKIITPGGAIDYDYLLVAVGAVTNFFGNANVASNAYGLKNLEDAFNLRNHILSMCELATQESDPAIRRELLTFIVTGGGATGVECIGGIAELVHHVLVKDYPELDFSESSLLLLEGGDRLLVSMPEDLSAAALAELSRKGIDVRFQAKVDDFDSRCVRLADGTSIPARTLVWGAGVRCAPIFEQCGVQTDWLGRAMVLPTLQLPDYPDVFVVGDAAHYQQDGRPLPMIAPVAVQQAETAAKNVLNSVQGNRLQTFVYRELGNLATIGRSFAVAHFNRWQFSGFFAWLLWLVVHLIRLVGFRNRFIVTINWAWDYFFYDRALRMIYRLSAVMPEPESAEHNKEQR